MFDEWTAAKEKSPSKQFRIRPVAVQRQVGPGLLAREMYDTYELATSLGVVSESGLCIDCGGKRRSRACSCPDQWELERAASLPLVDAEGCCTACSKKRRASSTCSCEPDAITLPSPGMVRYRELHAARLEANRRKISCLDPGPAGLEQPRPPQDFLSIPETDDTPGVLVDLGSE